MSTDTLEVTDEKLETGQGDVAHIVKDPQKVAQAYLEGTPIEALCGYVWVPSKSVKSLPICQMCKEMADAFMDGPDGGADNVEGVL
jgi:hypothetical protein